MGYGPLKARLVRSRESTLTLQSSTVNILGVCRFSFLESFLTLRQCLSGYSVWHDWW